MTDTNGNGLCVMPTGVPLHTRGLKDAASGELTLFASSVIAPPYDFSTNLLPDKLITLSRGEHQTGDFVMRPVGGGSH